jgi:hypothetical protein
MDAWVRSNAAPPGSSYPKIADGTLVPMEEYALPAVPGVNRPHEANEGTRLDFGPQWRDGILGLQPPAVGRAFPVLVPQVNEDGNERDGVRLPAITVPLATYVSWNLRDPLIGAPSERVAFEASYLPFPKTAADRERTHDPRKSIAERYANREAYLELYGHAIEELVKQHWILEEDRAQLMHRGEQEWDEATK